MSTVVTGYKKSKDLLLKGAPDRIIKKCTKFHSFDGVKSMSDAEKFKLLDQVNALAS
jgi:magnesium-transporting ATPase (P-type)